MSYHLEVTNNSDWLTLETSDGKTIGPKGGTWTSETLGNGWIASREFGTVNFLDIADKNIGGGSGETWGVLISYQGEEVVGRYEGGGKLSVVVNQYGQIELQGMNLRQVHLPGIVLPH